MKAHGAVDPVNGLVHTVTTTAANEADVEQIADLLHGKEEHVWADSGYRGAPAWVNREGLQWHIAVTVPTSIPGSTSEAAVESLLDVPSRMRLGRPSTLRPRALALNTASSNSLSSEANVRILRNRDAEAIALGSAPKVWSGSTIGLYLGG